MSEPPSGPASSSRVKESPSAEAAAGLARPTSAHLLQELANHVRHSLDEALAMTLAKLESGQSKESVTSKALAMEEKRSAGEVDDVRMLIHQLQNAKMKEKELRDTVEELQTEQQLNREKLSLYSIFALKLKRELINERLAHIDSKKEIEELQLKVRQLKKDSAGTNQASSPEIKSTQDHDPWQSPEKRSGEPRKPSRLLSFGSFYSNRGDDVVGVESEPSSPSSTMQPLRNSLIGQYLPSMLLDSPHSAIDQPKSFDEEVNAESQPRVSGEPSPAEKPKNLSASALDSLNSCEKCGNPCQGRCVPCNRVVCVNCSTTENSSSSPVCGTCGSVLQFETEEEKGSTDDDNQPAEALTDTGSQKTASPVVSPLTLTLMTELFESVPLEDLEKILKESAGHPSAAIEHVIQNHPSINPAVTSGDQSQPSTSLHRNASHRSNSVSSTGNQQSSNWKTELCVYYLQGKCNKTRRTCSFAHGESDLVRGNNKHTSGSGYKTRLCPLFLEGCCPKSRRECPLAHGESDMRDANSSNTSALSTPTPPRLQNYKTELCYYYLKGCCNYTKEECRFAHGDSDLRTVESNTLEWTAQISAAASNISGDAAQSSGPSTNVKGGEKHVPLHPSAFQQAFQQQYHQHQAGQPGYPGVAPYPMTQQAVPGQFPPPPPHHAIPMPTQHHSSPQQSMMQPVMYHQHPPGSSPAQPPPPYRYMKSVEDMSKRNRGGQSRRETSWSGPYDSMHSG